MGKGRGTRVAKRLLPYVPGQFIAEVNVTSKLRYLRMIRVWLRKAARKLPQRVKLSNMDI